MLYKLKNQKLEEFVPVTFNKQGYETDIEEWILNNPGIIFRDEDILFIQKERPITKEPDLLGIDKDGNLVLVEIKRGATPREVITQAIDYASDLGDISEDGLNEIAKDFFKKRKLPFSSLKDAFLKTFYEESEVENEIISFNKAQRIILFAERIDEDTKKMVRYMNSKGMEISCIEFTYYKSEEEVMIEINPTITSESSGKEVIYNQSNRQFWEIIAEKLYLKLDDPSFKNVTFRYRHRSGRIFQIGVPKMGATHFEFWIRKNNEFEISLHLEDAETRDMLYKFLKGKEKEIQGMLGTNIKVEPWGRGDKNEPLGTKYKRVGEIIKYAELNEEFANKIVNRMIELINCLKPMLDEATNNLKLTDAGRIARL